MKTLLISFAFLLTITFSFAASTTTFFCSCPTPQNVVKTNETSSSISFDWCDCSISDSFMVYYIKDGVQSAVFSTGSSDFNFTNLTEGTYEFYFHSNCGGVLSAPIIITEDLVVS